MKKKFKLIDLDCVDKVLEEAVNCIAKVEPDCQVVL